MDTTFSPSVRTSGSARRASFLLRGATYGCLALALGASICFGQPVVVSGQSMEPSFHRGQVIWLDRSAYRSEAPSAGEVIVFERDERTYIKRVYAAEGEVVYYLEQGGEWQEGPLRLAETPIFRSMFEGNRKTSTRVRALTVPRGQVFVIGDNHITSEDSRSFGPISVSSILGRVHGEADRTVTRHFVNYSHRDPSG